MGYSSVSGSDCCTPTVTPATPSLQENEAAKPVIESTPAPESTINTTESRSTSGLISIWVPFDAKVSINGHETKSVGTSRQYVSYGLEKGLQYKYVVKAETVVNGQLITDSKVVILTAGQEESVAFSLTPGPVNALAAK